MLMHTGYNIEWELILSMKLTTSYPILLPQLDTVVTLLVSQCIIGALLWLILKRHIQKPENGLHHISLRRHKEIFAITAMSFVLYLLLVIFYRPSHPWSDLSSNGIINFFPKIFEHFQKVKAEARIQWNHSSFNYLKQQMRAPAVQLARPTTILTKPIKHVFVIILESIRVDALPFDPNFANATGYKLASNVVPDDISPFFNSLWNNSFHTAATVTSSYSLKSHLSTLCGIYPLNINLIEEVRPDYLFYEKCIPELLRETFQTSKNHSTFLSGFFSASRGDNDRQRKLVAKMKFDAAFSGYDVRNRTPKIPDLGWFGPPDPSILPLMWDWIEQSLATLKDRQLMIVLSSTMTHTPFTLPSEYVKNSYRNFIKNNKVDWYLNGIRIVDGILKAIIDGFKARELLNDTLFVITSDHGFAFNDWSSRVYGALNNRLECGSQVPLMFYNPNLNAKHLNGQFTNMDILPSIMDVLLSSKASKQHSKNVLLSLPVDKFKSILSPYDGMSLLRQTVKQTPERYIFHLVNPGNSFITIKQYPRKLVYNVKRNSVQLYHLGYDPHEQVDLIRFENNRIVEYPKWLNTECNERPPRSRKWRWIANYTLYEKSDPLKRYQSESRFKQKNCADLQRRYGTVNLEEMLDWGEKTFQLAGAWRVFVKKRYVLGRSNVHKANGSLIA